LRYHNDKTMHINFTQLAITLMVVGAMQVALSNRPCSFDAKVQQEAFGWILLATSGCLLLYVSGRQTG